MASRRRGYRSRRLQAFHDDPQLLIIGPAPPSAGLNDLKPFNLSTVLMAVHKHCYTSLNPTQQGGPRRRETVMAGMAHDRADLAGREAAGYWVLGRLAHYGPRR